MNDTEKLQAIELLRYAQAAIANGWHAPDSQPDICHAVRFGMVGDIGADVREKTAQFVLSKLAPHTDALSWIVAHSTEEEKQRYKQQPISMEALQNWNVAWINPLIGMLQAQPQA